ncbi:hypothetical protein [Anaerospora sp.]|uniref:hypothetical protein n=1 Tax=Anaerospora sp. TaxID=1960278 RepID=UPI0028976454|nr:hypothetical protein [Anaerospora sp.]
MTMGSNNLVSVPPETSVQAGVDSFSQGLTRYLSSLSLPAENVLVEPQERLTVMNNLPAIVQRLNPQQKNEAMYISKFIAACGAGLFDAALNFLWNETVLNLRQKVIRFDINYFLDSIITDTRRRASFRNEDDLKNLDDWELIKGCKDTGIITDIGYMHLDYIRDMRNHASAAHPNHNDLDGLQLSSWLQTCIKEVLAKDPEGPVIEIRKLLNNLRTNVLSAADVPPIRANLQQIPVVLIDSTLRAIFGMYTDPSLAAQVRTNLRLIVSSVWENSSVQAKYDCGLKFAVFSANAEIQRKNLAHEFLDSLENGLSYLTNDHRIMEMDQVLDTLYSAHMGWNNFHNEPPHARNLAKYIPANGEIPREVLAKYIKVLIMCAIGNAYGISSSAEPIYTELISHFSDKHYFEFIRLLADSDIQSRLRYSSCSINFRTLASQFNSRSTNLPLKEALKFIADSNNEALPKLVNDTRLRSKVQIITLI